MITGSDTVFLCGADVGKSLGAFLRGRLAEWPEMLVSVSGVADDQFRPWAGNAVAFPAAGEVLVARDAAMDAAWDEHGYHLGASGEGPFAIFYEPFRERAVPMRTLADPYGRGEYGFEPYDLTVIGGGLNLVTLVTPDLESRFSRRLISSLVNAFR